MKKVPVVKSLIQKLGGRFSVQFKIDLESKDHKELFLWFLACLFFGARIGESIATCTFKEFCKEGLITPQAILDAGWNELIPVLGEGGYARYDNKTANKLLGISKKLIKEYDGNLIKLFDQASDPRDLEAKLLQFKGVGPITVNIFLRELRGIFEKAQPYPEKFVLLASYNLGFTKVKGYSEKDRITCLLDLEGIWLESRIKKYKFSDFESALVRLGKNFCSKKKCEICSIQKECLTNPRAAASKTHSLTKVYNTLIKL